VLLSYLHLTKKRQPKASVFPIFISCNSSTLIVSGRSNFQMTIHCESATNLTGDRLCWKEEYSLLFAVQEIGIFVSNK
jgi:hypothetical protein